MKQRDVLLLMDGIAPAVASLLGKAVAPIAARLADVEKQLADALAASAARPDVDASVARALAEQPTPEPIDMAAIERGIDARFAALPTPEPGKSVTIEEVRPLVAEAVAAAVAEIPVPKDGESVDPEAVKAMVSEAVAALPPAPAGKDADPEAVAALVRDAVAAGVTGMQAAVDTAVTDMRAAAETAVAEMKFEIGALPKVPTAEEVAALVPAPENGKDADPAAIKAMVEEAVAAIPTPKDGNDVDPDLIKMMVAEAVAAIPPAAPGKDADPEMVRAMVADAVRAIPAPENGKDASPEQIAAAVEKVLAAWERPKDGESVTVEQLQPAIEATVDKAMAARPLPKDGIGLAGAVKDHEGRLVLTLTNGTMVKLGRVDGEPGKPGADGFGFDDLHFVHDGERTFKFVFTRGEQIKEFAFSLPVVLDRGVFKDGTEYAAGDGATFGGSFWIAQSTTKDKPGTSDAWRLSVKKGRDGQDLRPIEPKPPATVKLK